MGDNIVSNHDLNELFLKLTEEAKGYIGDPEKVLEILAKAEGKLEGNKELRKAAGDIPGMADFLKDSVTGDYTGASEEALATVLGAFLYFIKEDDAINDTSPVIGFVDDLRVFTIAGEAAGNDLKRYAAQTAEQ